MKERSAAGRRTAAGALVRQPVGNTFQQSETEFAMLAEAIMASPIDAMIGRTLDGAITSWNIGAQRLLGYSAAEAIGRPITLILPPELHADVEQNTRRMIAGESIAPYEARHIIKDGRAIDVVITVTPIRNKAGAITGAAIILRDITALKRTEAALRERDAWFGAAFEQATVGMALRDIDPRRPRLLRVNQKLCDMLGYTREELLQLTSIDITPPAERDLATDYNEKLLRGEIAGYSREKCYMHKDGRFVWTDISLSTVHDADGRPTHVLSVIQDISARKQTEEHLRKLNRARKVMAECSRAMVHANDEIQLLQDMCKIAVESGGYRMAWVGYAEHDPAKSVRPVAQSGFDAGYLEASRISWGDNERGRGPSGRAIRLGEARVVRNALTDPGFAPWRENALQRGYRSHIALPLKRDGVVLGVFSLYATEVDAFDAEEIALLEDLAADLAYGIMSLRMRLDHARAEAALKANEELMRTTFEQAPVGVVHTALDRRYLLINQKFCDMIGYSRDELLTMRSTAITPPDDPVDVGTYRQRMLAGEINIYSGEKRYLRKDGTVLWTNRTVSLVRNGAGEPLYFIRMIEDISERRRTDQALRESEQRFRTIFNYAGVGIAMRPAHDRHHPWMQVNDQLCKLLGYTREELLGLSTADITPPDEHEKAVDDTQRLVNGEIENYVKEKRVLRKDGSSIWVILAVAALPETDGHPRDLIAIYQDITARKEAERQLAQLNRELERRVTQRTSDLAAANRELETFSYSVSHDLRAPLRAIGGYARLALEQHGSAMPEEARNFLARITRNVDQMNNLIDELLAYSRLQRHALQWRPVCTTAVVRECLETLRAGEQNRSIEVVVGELPDCEGDRVLLMQVWMNLLSNAFKFTARCEAARIEIGSLSAPEGTVYFVRDNGAGFDMQYSGKLFGVFQRLHHVSEFAGHGIGLATVHNILLRHGGRIWAEAAPGEGATFFFTLDSVNGKSEADLCVTGMARVPHDA